MIRSVPTTQLTIELIPHCTSVPRDGWTASHDVRPLAELAMRQAEALAELAIHINILNLIICIHDCGDCYSSGAHLR